MKIQANISLSAKPKREEGLAQGLARETMVLPGREKRDADGEAYGATACESGVPAEETTSCCEAAESKGLYKVGGR